VLRQTVTIGENALRVIAARNISEEGDEKASDTEGEKWRGTSMATERFVYAMMNRRAHGSD